MKIDCPSCDASYTISDDKIGPDGRKVKCARCGDVWHVKLSSEELNQDDVEALFAQETAASVAAAGGGGGSSSPAPAPAPPQDPDVTAEESGDDSEDGAGFSAEFDAFKAALSDQPMEEASATPSDDTDADPGEGAVVEGQKVQKPVERKRVRVDKKVKRSFSREDRKKLLWNSGAAVLVLLFIALTVVMRKPLVMIAPDLASFYETIGLDVNLRGLSIESVRTRRDINDGIVSLHVEGNIKNVTDAVVAVPYIRIALQGEQSGELYAWSIAPQSRTLPPGEWLSFKTSIPTPPAGAKSVEVRFSDEQSLQTGSGLQ
ncbi:MJ0042-type zinc finger domain-containing protein [Coralliovum pocilloporae]|uniref:MJ0042-type zinc finger domain-containing protein n=1 Tax=Coralliovum pocilloporae TaxID=3066369 RepID=UPI003307B36B